jgi:hypothetical protein
MELEDHQENWTEVMEEELELEAGHHQTHKTSLLLRILTPRELGLEVGQGSEELDVMTAGTGGEGQSAGWLEEPEDHLCFASLALIKAPQL